MKLLRRIFLNPIVIIVPIVSVVLLGWQQYVEAQPSLTNTTSNIMINSNYDKTARSGCPANWQVSPELPSVRCSTLPGQNTSRALEIRSEDAKNSVAISSPASTVQEGKTYLYKGFYKSTQPLDLVVQSNLKDGTSSMEIIRRYESVDKWSTVAYAFTANPNAQSTQFLLRFIGTGVVRLEGMYLEPNPDDVYISPKQNLQNNMTPNTALSSEDGERPTNWSSYAFGSNQADFSYPTDEAVPYVRTRVTSYKDGEAKWQHEPIAARSGQYFQTEGTYRSEATADLVAEFTLTGGERKFVNLGALYPTDNWLTYKKQVEAPADATNMHISVVLHHNGTLDVKNQRIYDISKAGSPHWKQPLVSYTFDDGWESIYANGVRLLDKYKYKATFYLAPSSIDTPGFMTSNQVSSLLGGGHELASHGHEHLDFRTLDKQSIDYQLKHAKEYFAQVHKMQAVDFASSFSTDDPEVDNYVRKYYASHRSAMSGVNTKQNFDPYRLTVFYITKDTPLAKFREALAETKAMNGWLILAYNRIESNSDSSHSTTLTDFQQQLDTVKKSGIAVKTVAAALEEVAHEN